MRHLVHNAGTNTNTRIRHWLLCTFTLWQARSQKLNNTGTEVRARSP
jgi:hypothetical protein